MGCSKIRIKRKTERGLPQINYKNLKCKTDN